MSDQISCVQCESVHLILIFFFNDTATTEIYTLSLHDALPISMVIATGPMQVDGCPFTPVKFEFLGTDGEVFFVPYHHKDRGADRKSTRLNSSHANISYAVFCLKKKISDHPLAKYQCPYRDTCD